MSNGNTCSVAAILDVDAPAGGWHCGIGVRQRKPRAMTAANRCRLAIVAVTATTAGSGNITISRAGIVRRAEQNGIWARSFEDGTTTTAAKFLAAVRPSAKSGDRTAQQ